MIERYTRPEMKKVWSETSKYDKWLDVELAVCEALADEGIIPSKDMHSLRCASYNQERLDEILNETRHEMTAFLSSITEFIGPEGRWLHYGLTTSDVWDTATSLQIIEGLDLLIKDTDELLAILRARALEHKDTLMMGRNHGVHAEPITFGLKMALWWDEVRRNRDRLLHAKDTISYGKISGPVGTHATVSPSIETKVCERLSLHPAPISNQVLQRDRHAEVIMTLSLFAASLEKFATEVRSLQRTETREVTEGFPKGQPGSSSMPHKRNPELSERVCGLARLIRGHAVTAMENVALWGERDISHSSGERIIFPDILDLFTGVIRDINIYPDQMMNNIESTRGVVFSQRVLLALINADMAREEAYRIVHDCAMRSWDRKEDFRELMRTETKVTDRLTLKDLDALFDYRYYIRHVDETFKRAGLV